MDKKALFAALRFTADENLTDRLYWYRAPFPLAEGEEVLAPVGVHDRLQRAVAERLLWAEESEAPYDVRLIKSVEARYGERMVCIGAAHALEFGGVRYDAKHYTRYRRALLCDADFKEQTVRCVLEEPSLGDADVYRELAKGGVLLVGGEGRAIFKRLYALLRGDEREAAALGVLGLGEREICALKNSLG